MQQEKRYSAMWIVHGLLIAWVGMLWSFSPVLGWFLDNPNQYPLLVGLARLKPTFFYGAGVPVVCSVLFILGWLIIGQYASWGVQRMGTMLLKQQRGHPQ